jgi:cephalosporin hydroxylase
MALAQIYNTDRDAITVTLQSAYKDRLSRWSDIQEYLPFLYDQVRCRPGAVVLELGTRKGNSTLAFLAAAESSGGHVWSADIDNVLKYSDGMMKWQHAPQWTFIQGDDLAEATQSVLPAEADVLFVDSDHSYEHVLAELNAYLPRVKPGGIALFHDTNITSWLGYEPPVPGMPPVAQALDEYCAEAGLVWQNLSGEYGLGIIRR